MRVSCALLLIVVGCDGRSSPPEDTGAFRADPPPIEPDAPPDLPSVEGDPSFMCGPSARPPAGVVAQVSQGDLWATIHVEPGTYAFEFGMVGDVNGDGCDDLGMGSSDGTRIFFGPLGRGDWGATEANLVLPGVFGRLLGGTDIDGDLRDEFWVGGWLWSFDGTRARVAFDSLTEQAELLDADTDGFADAFMARGASVVLAYGPLDTWDEPSLTWGCSLRQEIPGSSACFILPGSDSVGFHSGDVVTDLTGDGSPELIVRSMDEYGGYEGTATYAGGDLRGRLLGRGLLVDLTDVVTASTPVLGDLDLDGYDEIAAEDGVLEGATLLRAAPDMRLELPPDSETVVPRGDVDGDQVIDLHLVVAGTPVLASGTTVGVLPTDPTDPIYTSTIVTDGMGVAVSFRPDPWRVPSPGDITGDGRADLVTGAFGGAYVLASDDLFPD